MIAVAFFNKTAEVREKKTKAVWSQAMSFSIRVEETFRNSSKSVEIFWKKEKSSRNM